MKQAVVIMHGMGEQFPMQTLQEFVRAVWETDEDLIDRNRPDSTTGKARTSNIVWGKPDRRNRSFELRRMTTESISSNRGPTDFYEFYWAHLMHGTTSEHVWAWLKDLLFRRPRRVPRGVMPAWILLWLITLLIAFGALAAVRPHEDFSVCLLTSWCLSSRAVWGIGAIVVGALASTYLLKYVGDVARYVKASPPNVARRQEIREKGVELLETLMGLVPGGRDTNPKYDRIIVVAHSLGTIVAYDILTHCFARLSNALSLDQTNPERMLQPERATLESMIRKAAGLPDGQAQAEGTEASIEGPHALDLDAFQEQQARCRAELNAQGNPWTISDFVTLGAPLTHAEFLMAHDKADLRDAQEKRILPTCPPVLEFDGKTRLRHFSYRAGEIEKIGEGSDLSSPRLPHHAALFAYTRWTNLYSPHRAIFWGDLVSGPLGGQFGLSVNGREVSGIRDLAVLPERDELGRRAVDTHVPFFSHTKYWNLRTRVESGGEVAPPHHIRILREALNLKGG